jgi:N-acyl homoserine lactone hydrolase
VFEIHTLRLGELLVPHGDGFVRDPIHAWYATNGEVRLLIDSGMPDAREVNRRLKIEATGGGHASLIEGLRAVGVRPEEINFVVLTHLHFDHAWNLDLFSDACVIVQRDEVFHGVDPVATQRIYYFKETLIDLLQRRRPTNLCMVSGDSDLLPGFKLLKTPGHTPGMQVVVAETEKGWAALVSDLGEHYRCWHPADSRASRKPVRYLAGTFLPGAIRSESERTYVESMARVRAAADIVVPAHDFRVPIHMPDDWFDVPASIDGDLTDEPTKPGERKAHG